MARRCIRPRRLRRHVRSRPLRASRARPRAARDTRRSPRFASFPPATRRTGRRPSRRPRTGSPWSSSPSRDTRASRWTRARSHRAGRSYTVTTLEELRGEDPVAGAGAHRRRRRIPRPADVASLARDLRACARRRRRAPGRRASRTRCRPSSPAEWSRRLCTRRRRALTAKPAGAIIRAAGHRASDLGVGDTANASRGGADGIDAVRGLLPAAVLAYIERNHLYRSPQDAT